MTAEELTEVLLRLNAEGIDLHVHVVCDRGFRVASVSYTHLSPESLLQVPGGDGVFCQLEGFICEQADCVRLLLHIAGIFLPVFCSCLLYTSRCV